jgi:hypothetical protein
MNYSAKILDDWFAIVVVSLVQLHPRPATVLAETSSSDKPISVWT